MQNSDMPPKPEDMAQWEAEFNQLMNAQRDDGDWDSAMQRSWDEGVIDLDDSFSHNMKFDHEGLPIVDPYVFGLLSLYSVSAHLLTKYRAKQQVPRSIIFHAVTFGLG